jgi:tRNA pseudouridine55 synthase
MATGTSTRWQPVHGVMLLDKPRGLSSQHALQAVRRVLQAAKAGHTGTLDPLADGLLPLCFGAATKFAQLHLDADKAYTAVLQLGQTTSTDDAEGEITARCAVPAIDAAALAALLQRFIGDIEQTPPIYSALKRDGKPLYAYARAGQDVEIKPRRVRIDAIDVLGLDADRLTLQVRCGKGTYIRALARDIGAALGCGAHLAALRRTASGGFAVAQAHALDALRQLEPSAARALLLPPESLVRQMPRLDLDLSQTAAILHGRGLEPAQAAGIAPGTLRIHGRNAAGTEIFLGLAQWDGVQLTPQRLLSNEELLAQ